MKKMKLLALVMALAVAACLVLSVHYVLPRGEVVHLTGTEIMRFDNGRDGAAIDAKPVDGKTRDVRLVYAKTRDGGSVRTYRNEDNIFYAKFDSGSVNSEVQSVLLDQSRSDNLVPVLMLTHGWRIEFFSLYPNIIGMKRVAADYDYFPFHAIALLALLAALIAACGYGGYRLVRSARSALTRVGSNSPFRRSTGTPEA